MHMVDTPDDAELIRRYARGRAEEPFAELVQRYSGLVYHAARRQMGADAHAEIRSGDEIARIGGRLVREMTYPEC